MIASSTASAGQTRNAQSPFELPPPQRPDQILTSWRRDFAFGKAMVPSRPKSLFCLLNPQSLDAPAWLSTSTIQRDTWLRIYNRSLHKGSFRGRQPASAHARRPLPGQRSDHGQSAEPWTEAPTRSGRPPSQHQTSPTSGTTGLSA